MRKKERQMKSRISTDLKDQIADILSPSDHRYGSLWCPRCALETLGVVVVLVLVGLMLRT